MFLKNLKISLSFTIVFLFFIACENKRGLVNNPENYRPRYKENGGKIPTVFFNRNKVINETQYIAALAKLKQARIDGGKKTINKRDNENIIKDSTEVVVQEVSNEIQLEIDSLYKKLDKIDPYDDKSNVTLLEVLTQLNDLYYKKIKPYEKLKKKSVNTLKSDLMFQTGKSQLSNVGITEIQKLTNAIEDEIRDWKEYVDDHNEQIFKNDQYKVTIQINGYADKQGDASYNKKLSYERAKEVREVFIKDLKKITTKYGIRYSVNYEGKGEELPPNITNSPSQDDPKRRICVIYSVVGPLTLLKSK
jgi:outer membrane protein OmpA-like peptidoglycan-associated protein